MRFDALARRPADGVRRVADPFVFALATQCIARAIWTSLALPDAALSVVTEFVCYSLALSRLAEIGRLARLYRATAEGDVSGSVAGSRPGVSRSPKS